MKSFKWMLATLLAVAVCTPLMAQSNKDLGAKLQRQIQQQSKKHKAEKCMWCGNEITADSGRCPADPDVYCTPGPKSNQPTCYRCGKKFTEGEKCSATQNHRFCGASYHHSEAIRRAHNYTPKQAKAQENRCPKCGEEYDIDVIYHGMQHRCEAENNEPAKTQLTQEQQAAYKASMQALGVSEICELDPYLVHYAESLLQKDRDDHNGYPEHTFEYYYQQLEAERNAPAPEKPEIRCRWCGNVITSIYRPCPADPDVNCSPAPETGSAVGVQPNPGKTVSTAKDNSYCPKCGEKYDIDVLYHGMQHRCEKAEKPVKYHPAEK